ncbi:hypothetical protein LYSIN_00027 [Lysinibacillus sphaericus]|uniref:Uncharacterized protein n=1 Tax=Lysinibacillus sphaericus TaxID=1421 RepID=A0A2S5CWQ6_LYSSH|nr:hypothetical protein LYSIN_00027 [Lysinibacillus sphaericus]
MHIIALPTPKSSKGMFPNDAPIIVPIANVPQGMIHKLINAMKEDCKELKPRAIKIGAITMTARPKPLTDSIKGESPKANNNTWSIRLSVEVAIEEAIFWMDPDFSIR